MTPTPFTDQAIEYVDAMDYMTRDELSSCNLLYHDAEEADASVTYARFEYDLAEALEDGRDAVSQIRSIIRNANARKADSEGTTA